MPKEKIIVGLDIGTSKVATLIAKIGKSESEIEIIGLAVAPSTGVKKGNVVNIESTVSAIEKSVNEAEKMAEVRVNKVYVGIAGSHIKGINSRGVINVSNQDKEITRYDINRVVEAAQIVSIPEDRSVIHILPQDFIVDDQQGITEPLGISGCKLAVDVHIVTGSITAAQNLIRCTNAAGIEVEEIVLESLASSYAVLTEDEKQLGVALADMGGGTTDIAIFTNGILKHTAVISVGGDHLTSDLSKGLGTSIGEAERIKKEYSSIICSQIDENNFIDVSGVGGRGKRSISQRELSRIIQPRLEELFWLIHNDMRDSGLEGLVTSGLVLTGGTSQMGGIVRLAETVFSLPIRQGTPHGKIKGLSELINSPIYSTGVGLVLYAWKKHWEAKKNYELNIWDKTFGRVGAWMKEII